MVFQHLDKVLSKTNDAFRNSEWGPEAAESMCKELRDFTIPGRNNCWTMGDLIDHSPKDLISKVMFEENVFATWFPDRTVLLGDGSEISPCRAYIR